MDLDPPPLPDDLDPSRLRAALAGCPLGRFLEVHACLTSTMDRLVEWSEAGAPDGAVVVADRQSAGRGRLGRAWEAAPGQALMLSVLLRPPPELQAPEILAQLPMALALGTLAALRRRLPNPDLVALKWPNDLLLSGRKAAGLLTELVWDAAGPRVVLGLGLNVRQQVFADLPEATSLAMVLGADDEDPRLHRGDLAADLLRAAAAELARLTDGEPLTPRWAAELATLGRRVRVRRMDEGGPALEGLAEGVAADGALLLRGDDGVLHPLRAGDVSLAQG